MLPETTQRVRQNTADEVNERIERETEARVAWLATAGSDQIERRLDELEEEWDIERYLETMAPSLTLFGITLGATTSRKWLILPLAVQAFFLQHALQGWCPPLVVMRRLGVRTTEEINHERVALKALRGDFKHIETNGAIGDGVRALRAAAQ